MILDALFVTFIGMGGVFAFLLILIGGMNVLRLCIDKPAQQNSEKIAIAIAIAQQQNK